MDTFLLLSKAIDLHFFSKILAVLRENSRKQIFTHPSAGGEGSILAGGGSVIGVGSDIGGSIRLPCFFNGIFGHKTTPGERNLATESTHVFVSESNAPSIKKDLFCMIAEMIMNNVFVQGWCPVKTSSLLPLAASRNTSAVAPCAATPLTSSQCSRSWQDPRLTCKRGIDGSILTN